MAPKDEITILSLIERKEPIIDWPARMKIALGSANGLAYLHEECEFPLCTMYLYIENFNIISRLYVYFILS